MLTNKISLTVVAIIFCVSLNVQIINPVKWDYSIKNIIKTESMLRLYIAQTWADIFIQKCSGWRLHPNTDPIQLKCNLNFLGS
jgi:hypothetical protein